MSSGCFFRGLILAVAFAVQPFLAPGLGLVCVAADGALDSTFVPGGGRNAGFDIDVFNIAVQPDGRILAVGGFTMVDRTSRNRVARLRVDGSLDTGFNPGMGADDLTESIALQADGRVVMAGRFTSVDGLPRGYVARLNADGSLDEGFTPAADDLILSCAVQADGRIVLGGAFTAINGAPRRYVARLHPDGSVDPTFNPGSGPDLPVHALALDRDGRVLIGGQFTSVGSVPRIRVARLQADGSLDGGFDPGAGAAGLVVSLAAQPDGKVLVGGHFDSLGGSNRVYLGRLEADGRLDSGFDAGINIGTGGVLAIRPLADSRILIGGEIYWVDGLARNGIARVLADGSVDATFDPGAGPGDAGGFAPMVRGLALQADGRVLVGGRFTTFDGEGLNYIARLLSDVGGTIEFESESMVASEDAGIVRVQLVRSGTTAGPVTVQVGAIGGTATPDLDFSVGNATVVFDAGIMTAQLELNVVWDSEAEGDESIVLGLGEPVGGLLRGARSITTLTIEDRLTVPAPRFTDANLLPGNQLRLTLEIQPGVAYILESTENLTNWIPGQTATGTTATLVFDEPLDPGVRARLFRAGRQ